MAIGNERYSHFNTQTRETISQNIEGRETFVLLSPNQTIGGYVPPSPGFGAYNSLSLGGG